MIHPAVSRFTISQPTRLSAASSQMNATDRELGHFIGPIVVAVRVQVNDRSEPTQEAVRIVEERARDAHVFDVLVGDRRDRAAVE